MPKIDSDFAAAGFAAAGSRPRLDVLRALVRAGPDGLTVNEIQDRTRLPASTLAHHLRHLSVGGLVSQQKVGRSVVSRAKFDHIEALANFLLSECCVDQPGASNRRSVARRPKQRTTAS